MFCMFAVSGRHLLEPLPPTSAVAVVARQLSGGCFETLSLLRLWPLMLSHLHLYEHFTVQLAGVRL
jgi:hypothetical protein